MKPKARLRASSTRYGAVRTHKQDMRGHETEVTVTFEPVTGGTRMVLTQQGFVDADSRGRHEHGWSSSFVCLAREAVKR
jgi:hypothetical protein